MRIYKGNIITCDSKDNVFNYLVEDKGIITYIGNELPQNYENIEIIDLGERALTPTFVDNHSHFASYSGLASAVSILKAKNIKEIQDILKDSDLKLKKNRTILVFGASSSLVAEGRLIGKKDIDEVVPDRNVIIITTDGHSLIVNEKALNKLPKEIKSIRGYDAETGIMRNEAFYKVVDNLTKFLKLKDMMNFFQNAVDGLILKGIGMVHAASGSGFPGDLDVDLIRYIARGQKNGFQMRVFFQTFDTKKVIKRKLPRLGGCFKTALDGSIQSMDAAMLRPYEDTDNCGILYYTDEELYKYLSEANRKGLQIEMHSIGDAAFSQATRILKRVLDEFPRENHRHGIIHASLVTEEGIKICKDYKIQIVAQPAYLDVTNSKFKPMFQLLGDRVFTAEPYRKFINEGLVVSAGSDAPVTMPDPIEWLYKACNNPNTLNKMTIQEAMKVCTYNGYYATFDEDKRGSLEKGKIADMVILSRNPYSVKPEELNNLQVEQTILGGKIFTKRKRSFLLTLLRGMLSREKI